MLQLVQLWIKNIYDIFVFLLSPDENNIAVIDLSCVFGGSISTGQYVSSWTYWGTKSTSYKSSLYWNWMRGRLLLLLRSGGMETTVDRPCAILCTHKALCTISAVKRAFSAAGATVFNVAVSSNAISFFRLIDSTCNSQKKPPHVSVRYRSRNYICDSITMTYINIHWAYY
jgi:hypothetical protein